MSIFTRNDQKFDFHRYPPTSNQSLRPWSAADELLLQYFDEFAKSRSEGELSVKPAVYHDRFGFLGTVLQDRNPFILYNYSSQDKSIRQNMKLNKLEVPEDMLFTPFTDFPEPADIILMKIPKTLDLFRLYLHHAWKNLSDSDDAVIYCGFMTRHFTPQILEIAADYFELTEQTRARKKARLLVLKGKKKSDVTDKAITDLINEIEWSPAENSKEGDEATEAITLKQYYGVFSSGGVDPATTLLLNHLSLKETDLAVLDMGCGNGIIAKAMKMRQPEADVHAMDDDFLAVESARLNTDGSVTAHHYDSTDMFPDGFFDLVVSNPPAHLGHENNIEVSIGLFDQVAKKIKTGGRLVIVASKHLNYTTHLTKRYIDVKKLAEDDKSEVIEGTVA